jgi:hypothetical protein
MKKALLPFIIILLIFSCKSTGEKKTTPVSNIFLEYRAMGNSFADISFLLYKNKTFKINLLILSDKSKAIFDGSWDLKNNKIELSFNRKISRYDVENIFDVRQNRENKIPVEMVSNRVLIPDGLERIWMFNVLCKRK